MILLSTVNILLLCYLLHNNMLLKKEIIAAYLIPLTFLLLWLFELNNGGISFFISDEALYYENAFRGFPRLEDRFLWQLVNYWVVNHDIWADGLPLKLLNIPVYVAFVILLVRIFPYRESYLIPLFLPYSAFCAIFNLRDMAIWFFSTCSIYLWNKDTKSLLLSFAPLVFLYLLRPFVAILIGGILVAGKIYDLFANNNRSGDKRFNQLLSILAVAAILYLIYHPLSQKIVHYFNWYDYTTNEGHDEYVQSLPNAVVTGNIFLDFVISLMRYLFAPMPQSLIVRLLKGGTEQWGLVDDIIRTANQIGYYLIMFYLAFNIKHLLLTVRRITKTQAIFLVSMIMYWPIYAYHLYGVSHQRLKLPLQIALFCLLVMTYNNKNNDKCYHQGTG